MPSAWSPPPPYEAWSATCDTLHAHTQVLGKLAAKLAPPQPQLQHAALRLTARGWETAPLPSPDGSGSFGVALDLHRDEAIVEHVDGRIHHVPLTPNRPVRDVTRDVLAAVDDVAGRVEIDPTPQETAWETPLDEDTDHTTYDPLQVAQYLQAAAARHRDIKHHHVPFFLPDFVQGFLRVAGFPERRLLELIGENLFQAVAHDGVIVC